MTRWRIKGWRKSGWLGRTLWVLFVVIFAAPVTLLLIFRFLPVPGTPEMLLSLIEGKGAHYSWTDEINPVLGRSVIGSEDQNFCSHRGFDFKALAQVMDEHRRHPERPLRGASTLSQQTAHTLFLAPVRSWIRKGAEAWLTVLEEALWPKRRILQAYLNLVDWVALLSRPAGVFIGTDQDGVGLLENAFRMVQELEPIRHRLREAKIKDWRAPQAANFLTASEQTSLQAAEAAVHKAIMVDDFAVNDLNRL